ncbi:TPA: hypothetical protein ACY3HI_002818 [Citrobacter braakii]
MLLNNSYLIDKKIATRKDRQLVTFTPATKIAGGYSISLAFLRRCFNLFATVSMMNRIGAQSGAGGVVLSAMTYSRSLGSMPNLQSFSRQASLTQELNPPCPATDSILQSNSSSNRIIFLVLPERSVLFFTFFSCIGSYRYVRFDLSGMNQSTEVCHKKQRPTVIATHAGRLTTTVKESNEAAMKDTTPTQIHPSIPAISAMEIRHA